MQVHPTLHLIRLTEHMHTHIHDMINDNVCCSSIVAVLWGVWEVYIAYLSCWSSTSGLCHNRIVYHVMVCTVTTGGSHDKGTLINPTTVKVYFKCQRSSLDFARQCCTECLCCWFFSLHCNQGSCRVNNLHQMGKVMVCKVKIFMSFRENSYWKPFFWSNN